MKEVWDCSKSKYITMSKDIEGFLNEIKEISKKYNLSISHEDGHGAFLLERYSENNIEWLFEAHKNYK